VQKAEIQQGSKTIVITINELETYIIQGSGRWSDDILMAGFDPTQPASLYIYYPDQTPWSYGGLYSAVIDAPPETPETPTPVLESITIPFYCDCSSTDGFANASAIDISPAGQFYFNATYYDNAILANEWVPSDEYCVKTKLYLDNLYQLDAIRQHGFSIYFQSHYFDWEVAFTVEGLVYYENWDYDNAKVLCPIKHNANAAWQEWMFKITGGKVEVFLKDEGESFYSSVGSFNVTYFRDVDTYDYEPDTGFQFQATLHPSDPDATATKVHMDSFEILQIEDLDITDVISTATITVTDNTLVLEGETLAINIGNIPIVYTFVNILTGADNQIMIGSTANLTAANIASALYATKGAYFSATTTDAVVSVTVYTDEIVTMSTTSAGLSISAVTRKVTYRTSKALSSVPVFCGYSICKEHGTLGDVYHLSFIPIITGDSACSEPDYNIANRSLSPFGSYANSFLSACTISSADADKIALMLYGNSWMEALANMLIGSETDEDLIALWVTQWVAQRITYTTDLLLYGVTEHWADPRKTFLYGAGDCEDFAFLVASIIINSGVAPSRVRVYMGTANGVGHSWTAYRRTSDEEWIALDATKG